MSPSCFRLWFTIDNGTAVPVGAPTISDLFISYASEDRQRIQLLAYALEGWSVWWDRRIPIGRSFDEVIEKAVDASKAVVVVWTKTSPTRPGIAGGRFTAQDFQFTAKVSKASPKLFEACATGTRLRDVTLFARKAGTDQQDYLRIRLSDVVISSYQQSESSGTGDVPVDQVSCGFARIDIEYRAVNPDGSLSSPVKAGFDLKANRPT